MKDIIQKQFPFLEIRQYKVIDTGADNTIIMINSELIFRFPKIEEVFFEREKEFMDVIEPHTTFAIPHVNIYNVDGVKFTMHKMIKGDTYKNFLKDYQDGSLYQMHRVHKELKGSMYNDIMKEQESMIIDNISTDLSIFLAELHSIKTNLKPQEEHSGRSIKNKDVIIDFLKTSENIKKFEELLILNEKYENEYANKDLVICHNDLHGGNFLINKKNGRITGIIDFGDVSIRNYSTEFFMLFEDDERLAMETLKKYEKLLNKKVDLEYIETMRKYRAYRKIGEGITKGVETPQKFFKKIDD
jgi:aminoglycoside 2''-phosphotransferase